MSYTKQTWANGDIITAAKLNHMEDGIAGVEADVSSLDTRLLASMPHDTASGSIASFPDGAAMPVIDCSVAVAPNQDLHGYDNPWPAGGGVNKYPESAISGTNNAVTVTQNGGSYSLSGTASAYTQFISTESFTLQAGTYTLKEFNWVASIYVQLRSLDGQSVYANTAGEESNTFTLESETTVKARIVVNANTVTNRTIQIEIVSGSTAPSVYSPYSNICPISGWTECKVTRTGKNLWQFANAYTAVASSTLIANQALSAPMKAGNYVLSCYGSIGNAAAFTFRDSANNALATVTLNSSSLSDGRYVKSFTLSDTAVKLNLFTNNTLDINNIQVEVGTTATAFETPVTPQVYTIDLDGTRYGGTLDVTSGKLTVTLKSVNIADLLFSYSSSDLYFKTEIADRKVGNFTFFGSSALAISPTSIFGQMPNWSFVGGGSNKNVYIKCLDYTDPTAFKNALSGQTIVYELATPIEVDLTPAEITTLLGTNNIFADCGDTTVDYYADTTLFVNKKIAAAVAALS